MNKNTITIPSSWQPCGLLPDRSIVTEVVYHKGDFLEEYDCYR